MKRREKLAIYKEKVSQYCFFFESSMKEAHKKISLSLNVDVVTRGNDRINFKRKFLFLRFYLFLEDFLIAKRIFGAVTFCIEKILRKY